MPKNIGGGPDKPIALPKKNVMMNSESYFPSSSQGVQARALDVRDAIAGFIGRKDKDLTSDQSRKDFALLSGQLGPDMARKVLNHVIIFNNRASDPNAPFEKRLQSLYDIGSNDKDVDTLLKRTAMLEQGPIPGARTSSNVSVMQATNRPTGLISPSTPLATTR